MTSYFWSGYRECVHVLEGLWDGERSRERKTLFLLLIVRFTKDIFLRTQNYSSTEMYSLRSKIDDLGGLVWPSGFQWYDMVQCRPVFACGSSIAGIVSFLEEAELNKVMMVPSSDQLTVGKVGHALWSGWTRMVDVPHVGEWNYSFRYQGRATSTHCSFFMKAIVSTVTIEECETRQPSELGMCTTPSFLM